MTADELREFLEADVTGVCADPAFKAALREKLWESVCARRRGDPREPERND